MLSALTCDICGLRLISFRLMVSGLRLFSSWHRSTPSRRVWAKSKTCAESAVTRWFRGKTLQPISHRLHCLQYSIMRVQNWNEKLFQKIRHRQRKLDVETRSWARTLRDTWHPSFFFLSSRLKLTKPWLVCTSLVYNPHQLSYEYYYGNGL